MGKKLIALGHGPSRSGAWDPGARGNGTTEADFLRGGLLTSLKKYANNSIEFYEQNMFANRDASSREGYSEVVELHLDAAAPSVKGGHIIIHTNKTADALDRRLGASVDRHFGLRGGRMFDKRNNLHNLNVFANRGIPYRLLELGFITNQENMDYFKKNYDSVARDLIADILNQKTEYTSDSVSSDRSFAIAWVDMSEAQKYQDATTAILNQSLTVWQYQQMLMDAGKSLPRFGADNYFGAETLAATESFQKRYDISSASGKFFGRPGPATVKKLRELGNQNRTVHLPASAETWRTYRLNVQPITRNSDWSLTPARFGGLTYDILDEPQKDVVTINTSKGRRNIYVGSDTSAVIQ